ncbi:MAG: VOC family virulence protein [Legionellales bacterium]|nr:VOC family virulence protein [Legionellales bacterium]|tara:strand:- start:56 stop:433 length:378 start_codon:yes stop_codon:yes gene_type:complete
MKIAGIDHIVLMTNKLQEMLHFYCDVLGCTIEKQQPNLKLTQLRAGNCLIDIVEQDESLKKEYKNMDHFCLQVKDFDYDALSQLMQANKISVSRYGERYGAEGMGMSFFITDPQGNDIEMKESQT